GFGVPIGEEDHRNRAKPDLVAVREWALFPWLELLASDCRRVGDACLDAQVPILTTPRYPRVAAGNGSCMFEHTQVDVRLISGGTDATNDNAVLQLKLASIGTNQRRHA